MLTLARVAAALCFAAVVIHVQVPPVVAECTGMDRWPSFTAVAPSADTIVLAKVVEGIHEDSTDRFLEFVVTVREVVKGTARDSFTIAAGTRFPGKVTCRDSMLRVHVGDVIALALAEPPASTVDRVLAVAWTVGKPSRFLMPGVGSVTAAEVRRIANLPATDAQAPAIPTSRQAPPAWVLVAAALGALLIRRRLARG